MHVFFLKIKRLFDCGIYILPCLANTGLKKNIDTIKKTSVSFLWTVESTKIFRGFFFQSFEIQVFAHLP